MEGPTGNIPEIPPEERLSTQARPSSSGPFRPFRALSLGDLFEAPQGLDLFVELVHPVHRIEHHHLGAELLPAFGGAWPRPRVGLVHAQPCLEAEAAGSRPNARRCSCSTASFGSADVRAP